MIQPLREGGDGKARCGGRAAIGGPADGGRNVDRRQRLRTDGGEHGHPPGQFRIRQAGHIRPGDQPQDDRAEDEEREQGEQDFLQHGRRTMRCPSATQAATMPPRLPMAMR